MTGNITLILQFIVGMSIIVGIHELGHLLMAKMFGMQVESYGIGMPPKIFSKNFRGTEYYLGSIPFGGAVVISGMIKDDEEENSEPKEWEFSSKPAWQRLLVILGGIIFNFITSVIVFSAIFSFVGKDIITKDQLNQNGIVPTELGASSGLIEGDKILEINGKKDFVIGGEDFTGERYEILVSREGQEVMISVDLTNKSDKLLFNPRLPFYVENLVSGGSGEKAGLKKGDDIIEIAGIKTPYLHVLKDVLSSHKNCNVSLVHKRDGEVHTTQASISELGTLDIIIGTKIEKTNIKLGPIDSFSLGFNKFVDVVQANARGIYMLITGKLSFSKSISGPIGIARIFGKTFDILNFFTIVASLSAVLGFINLLPLPALDGGHGVLIILEMILRKRLPFKILHRIQYIGVGLLLILAAFTVVNDIIKLFV